jgi:cobyrinic acid a,c-diamide synthase
MIETSLDIPSFGMIPRKEDLAVKSRHLGLMMAHESGAMADFGNIIEEHADLDALISSAACAPPLKERKPTNDTIQFTRTSVGIALDDAFCFYYQDNLDLLQRAGAELVFFSPLTDPLPEVNSVYLGGGYPELHLSALASSRCRKDLKKATDSGMPLYAECGGLMYLVKEVTAGKTYKMCGILPAAAEMTRKIQALGYVKGKSIRNNSFLPAGQQVNGHEFHYSRIEPERDVHYALQLSRGKGIDRGYDGIISQNALGCYTHAYFSRAFVNAFIDAAVKFSKR